jgi:hypothetical protein
MYINRNTIYDLAYSNELTLKLSKATYRHRNVAVKDRAASVRRPNSSALVLNKLCEILVHFTNVLIPMVQAYCKAVVFNLSCSLTPRYNFSSTLYPQSFWCLIQVIIVSNFMKERERERERNGAPKSNVLTSGSPMANPKSGPDYSVFIMK